MRRLLISLGVGLLTSAGFMLGMQLLAPAMDDGASGSPRFVETDPCADCPVVLRSAEVQARQGSTLFIFGGGWPGAVSAIPADIKLEANGAIVTLHPTDRGFEIVDASGLQVADVSADLQEGSLLLNITRRALDAPVTFTFGTWEGDTYSGRMPRDGELRWAGTGAPIAVGDGVATEPTQPEPETPEAFLDALAGAIRDGDAAFLVQRLHPAVLERYGSEQCSSHLAGIHDPTRQYEVRGVANSAPWEYASDGLVTVIADAVAVETAVTLEGESQRSELHVAPASDGGLAWFTDCGRPLA